MKKVIILRYAEIYLKGKNRGYFERALETNLLRALKGIDCELTKQSGRYLVSGFCDDDVEEMMDRIKKVFGIHSFSIAYETESDLDSITDAAVLVCKETGTFKVESHRGDKKYPLTSIELSREIGGRLLSRFHKLKVDVHEPSFTIRVDIRENGKALGFGEFIAGSDGMPVGTAGRGLLLLSGGIDSPVAGYMIGKRGVNLCAVHFYSYPYTSERAKEKVVDLAKLVAKYTGTIKLVVVPFTDIQLAIDENCRSELSTVIMRRSMMRIACRVARMNGCSALITGESVGQVASQTMQAIYCTNEACDMPVYRPLIGMDKMEVVAISQDIGTFETSILPYEDCCTVFTPKHPKTKPSLKEVVDEEARYNYKELENIAIENVEVISCS